MRRDGFLSPKFFNGTLTLSPKLMLPMPHGNSKELLLCNKGDPTATTICFRGCVVNFCLTQTFSVSILISYFAFAFIDGMAPRKNKQFQRGTVSILHFYKTVCLHWKFRRSVKNMRVTFYRSKYNKNSKVLEIEKYFYYFR